MKGLLAHGWFEEGRFVIKTHHEIYQTYNDFYSGKYDKISSQKHA